MNRKQVQDIEEAVTFLELAASNFDQACAYLQDAGLYNSEFRDRAGRRLTASNMNREIESFLECVQKSIPEPGSKCECVETEESHQFPKGVERADPNCDLCNGTGHVGMDEYELVQEDD